jgi:hypothetical protein
MATKLAVFNGALRLLKERKLDTLTDDEFKRYELDAEYDATIAYMLEKGLWNFAMRTVTIDEDVSVDPAFGFNYAFEKPSDWVRTWKVSANPRLFPVMGAGEYIHEGAYWSANVTPIYVSYVSNGASYGLDLTAWPASFIRAVEFELALRVAPTITSFTSKGRGSDMETLTFAAKRELRKAQGKDAIDQAPTERPPGRLTMSRRGNNIVASRDD